MPSLTPVPPARHLLRAKDLIDARFREPLDVQALARAAYLSPAHFSREFRRAFGETPHQYLLTRRLDGDSRPACVRRRDARPDPQAACQGCERRAPLRDGRRAEELGEAEEPR